ncbi:hypothetical protein FQ707_14115 [Bacteroidaceae bacterium HV4-6-C5C]|nr:hypothetical protein FQ707_14115 [Bacteroidaceae bacterium HV4-6-C5C]
MLDIIGLFVGCCSGIGTLPGAYAQSSDQNYILTRTFTNEDGTQYLVLRRTGTSGTERELLRRLCLYRLQRN